MCVTFAAPRPASAAPPAARCGAPIFSRRLGRHVSLGFFFPLCGGPQPPQPWRRLCSQRQRQGPHAHRLLRWCVGGALGPGLCAARARPATRRRSTHAPLSGVGSPAARISHLCGDAASNAPIRTVFYPIGPPCPLHVLEPRPRTCESNAPSPPSAAPGPRTLCARRGGPRALVARAPPQARARRLARDSDRAQPRPNPRPLASSRPQPRPKGRVTRTPGCVCWWIRRVGGRAESWSQRRTRRPPPSTPNRLRNLAARPERLPQLPEREGCQALFETRAATQGNPCAPMGAAKDAEAAAAPDAGHACPMVGQLRASVLWHPLLSSGRGSGASGAGSGGVGGGERPTRRPDAVTGSFQRRRAPRGGLPGVAGLRAAPTHRCTCT
jgi:hypothetical protein